MNSPKRWSKSLTSIPMQIIKSMSKDIKTPEEIVRSKYPMLEYYEHVQDYYLSGISLTGLKQVMEAYADQFRGARIGEQHQQWVSRKDNHPPVETRVLVLAKWPTGLQEVWISFVTKRFPDVFDDLNDNIITHWQPLPEILPTAQP